MAAKRPRPTLEEILNALRAHLPELGERYGITSLGVFGSYVRGEQRSRSDEDVLILGHLGRDRPAYPPGDGHFVLEEVVRDEVDGGDTT